MPPSSRNWLSRESGPEIMLPSRMTCQIAVRFSPLSSSGTSVYRSAACAKFLNQGGVSFIRTVVTPWWSGADIGAPASGQAAPFSRIGLPQHTAFFKCGLAHANDPLAGLMSNSHVSDTTIAPWEYPARANPCWVMRSRCRFICTASSARPATMDGPIGTG